MDIDIDLDTDYMDIDELDIRKIKKTFKEIEQYNATNKLYVSENVFNVFLLKTIRENNENVCDIFSYNSFLSINLVNFTYTISKQVVKMIQNCQDNDKLIVLPVSLTTSTINHANCIIINKKKRYFEYFEPYGHLGENLLPSVGFGYDIEGILQLVLSDITKKNFMIHPVGKYTPLQEESEKQFPKKGGGFCMGWVLLFIYLRIENPDMNIVGILQLLYENVHLIENFITKIEKDVSNYQNLLFKIPENIEFNISKSILNLLSAKEKKNLDKYLSHMYRDMLYILKEQRPLKKANVTTLLYTQEQLKNFEYYEHYNEIIINTINTHPRF